MNACGEPVRPGDIAQAVVGEAGTWQQASPGERFGQVQENGWKDTGLFLADGLLWPSYRSELA
jgi:hypothetical protein